MSDRPHRLRFNAALGVAALGLAALAGCRTTEDMQRDYAQTLTPRQIEASAPAGSDVAVPKQIREYRVRAYADADYQRQTLRWREGIESQINRANRVLEGQFGVRLVLKDVRSGNRSGHSDSLDKVLDELSAADRGDDVDWVVGFVSSLEIFAATYEQLGWAAYFSKHLVLRGMFSMAEVDNLNKTLDQLSDKERDTVTRERRLHKQTEILLHEWAHTLGAFHERSGDWIMSTYYDTRHIAFSPETVHLVLVSLAHRDDASTPAGREALARAYRDEVVRFSATAAEPDQVLKVADRMLARSSAPPGTAPVSGTTPVSSSPAPSPTATAAPTRAKPPATEVRRPKDEGVRACLAAQARARRTPETLETCRRAADRAGAPPEAGLLLASTLLDQKQVDEAVRVLARAENALSTGASAQRSWVVLAQLYDRADTCTGAERAARRAAGDPGAAQVIKECTLQRRWVALPSGAKGIPLEREHTYVETVQQAQRDIDARRPESALARAEELERLFPGSPGPALIVCLADGRGADAARAKASCTRATTAAPDASAAWFLLGKVASSEGQWDDARKCLVRALELDGGIGEAWKTLASAYAHLGDTRALAELKSRYHARFGTDLR